MSFQVRPIITVVTMIALVVFGLASLARLDTDEFPDLDQPIVFLGIAYPGAAPDVVEREVVTRLEDKLSGISGVDKINSTSTDGFAQIVIQFALSKPVSGATQDVRERINPNPLPRRLRTARTAVRSQYASHRVVGHHVEHDVHDTASSPIKRSAATCAASRASPRQRRGGDSAQVSVDASCRPRGRRH
jgi:multidrug efflux pump subunit AcrB